MCCVSFIHKTMRLRELEEQDVLFNIAFTEFNAALSLVSRLLHACHHRQLGVAGPIHMLSFSSSPMDIVPRPSIASPLSISIHSFSIWAQLVLGSLLIVIQEKAPLLSTVAFHLRWMFYLFAPFLGLHNKRGLNRPFTSDHISYVNFASRFSFCFQWDFDAVNFRNWWNEFTRDNIWYFILRFTIFSFTGASCFSTTEFLYLLHTSFFKFNFLNKGKHTPFNAKYLIISTFCLIVFLPFGDS